MFKLLKTYWTYGNSFCSLEVVTAFGEQKIHVVKAKKKKDEFKEIEFFDFSEWNQLTNVLGNNQHAYLTINTDKVLIKEAPLAKDPNKTISNAFPSLPLSEFYYNITPSGKNGYVAICRKEDVHNLLEDLEKLKIHVIGFQLGFAPISKLLPLIKEQEFSSSRFKFTQEDASISAFSESTLTAETYEIEDTKVSSNHLLSLSGLFNYVSEPISVNTNISDKNKSLYDYQQQKNFFRKGFWVGIGILLLTLSINFFFFNSYFDENQKLQETSEFLKTKKAAVTSKSVKVMKKEKIVSNILNSGNSKSSFYINRITVLKPVSILFSGLEFQPLVKSIRADKKIDYNQMLIKANGESTDKAAFSNWITSLEKLDWVEHATVTAYSTTKNISSFGLTIKIKDDAKE